MIRLVFFPFFIVLSVLRHSHSRGGIFAFLLAILMMLAIAVAPWWIGISDGFQVSTLLGVVLLLFPGLWYFDWVFGVVHLLFHANVWMAIARLLHG